MATKVYYYAYVNEQDIVEQVFSMPAPITSPQYISIPAYDETLIGKRYNRETGEFETVSWYYYAILGDKDIVTDVIRQETALPVVPSNMVQLTSFDETLVGKWYDRVNNVFTEPPVHILADLSTDKINVGTQDIWLTDKLTQLDAADVSAATALGAQENRIAGVEGRVGTAESRLTAAEETGAANASRIGAAETRLTGVEATAANNASRIGSVEGRVGTTETRVTGVEATATSNANRLGGVEGRVGAVENRMGAAESRLPSEDDKRLWNNIPLTSFVARQNNFTTPGGTERTVTIPFDTGRPGYMPRKVRLQFEQIAGGGFSAAHDLVSSVVVVLERDPDGTRRLYTEYTDDSLRRSSGYIGDANDDKVFYFRKESDGSLGGLGARAFVLSLAGTSTAMGYAGRFTFNENSVSYTIKVPAEYTSATSRVLARTIVY